MRAALSQTASIAILAFAVSSMMSVGLAYSFGQIIRRLRGIRSVFRALIANFVLVPLLAIGIEQVIPLDAPHALGLFLLAGSAGAPFLIKLADAAKTDLATSAALLLLLIPMTVVFLPFYVPLATAHPSLSDLSYVPSNVFAIGLPLLSTLVLPLLLGNAIRAIVPRRAARLVRIGSKASTVALVVVVLATFGANLPELIRTVETGAIFAGILLVVGAFLVGNLLSRRDRSTVLGLGTAQRNIAGAMMIASRDFTDPEILVMVTACSIGGLLVLFPIAWALSRTAPEFGLPTPAGAPA
jgi:BASS family bile acid:Na+ symporter